VPGGSGLPPPTANGTLTYTNDAEGDRNSAIASTGASQTYSYNQALELTGIGSEVSYTYNGDGLRMSKTVGTTTTPFTWDVSGGLPSVVEDGNNAYVYGPGGLPLEQVSGNTALWFHHDQLGSTRLLTNEGGQTVASYAYTPYGSLSSSSSTASTPLLYAGQYRDSESGLYYLRARFYDPTTAQFLTVDPAASTTRSPYAYVAGNPLTNTDPTGMWGLPDLNPVDWAKAGAGAATSAWNATGGQVVHAVQNGGLPNGHCIVLIQNNCQEDLVNNIHAVEDAPIGPVLRADPFIASEFDLAKARSGEDVGNLQGAMDILGMAFVFTPARFGPGSIPARILGPGLGDWAGAANAWNNRRWISRIMSICKNEITGGH
jgi:RHS repeat-associated protein